MNKLSQLPLLLLMSLTTAGPAAAFGELTEDDLAALLQVRPALFGGSEIQAALEQSTINGEQPPLFGYDTADRAILSWTIEDHVAESFALAIGLPPWMSLAKVSPITGKQLPSGKGKGHQRAQPESYRMLVDIANTERTVQGTLVEWKTFVTVGADPVPRLLRFDFQNAIPGVDLLDLFAPPFGLVEWSVDGRRASGNVTDGARTLNIEIPLDRRHGKPGPDKHQRFTEEFLTAGEQVFSPMGSRSRYYYDGSSVSAEITSVDPRSCSVINTFPWAAFAGPLDSVNVVSGKTEHLVQPIGLPVKPGSFEAGLFAQLSGMILGGADEDDVFALLGQAGGSDKFPTLYYGMLHLYQALRIFAGQELPKLQFSLKRSPMAVFINFEIPPQNVRAFEEAFLPDHFELAKIRFYPEQKKAIHAVTLNVYEAVGQSVSGYRAEWSTYVLNPNEENPQPRFSIIEAQTTSFGLDPLGALDAINSGRFDPNDLFTLLEGPADVFEYSLDEDDGLNITIRDFAEELEVDVSMAYPEEADILHTRPLKRWMEANDLVYWGEAADVLKYDSNVMFAELIVFPAGPEDLISDNAFSEYVDPEPLPIILWNGVQDIALEPWGNLQDIAPGNLETMRGGGRGRN